MKKISAVTLKAIPMIMALLLMLGILYAESVTANAVSGPRPSNQAGIVVGFTHFGDSEVMYLGNSKSKTASFEGFKYNKSNNTLTLDNIGTDEYYGLSVYDMGDDFKINVKGKNSLGYLYVYSNVKDRMNLTITGTGTLTINSDGAYGAAIHGYANGKSNTKITIDNTVNLNLYGGYNVFEEKNEKVIEVTGAKSSKQSDVFKIGGKKTGSTKVSKKKSKKGYNYKYGGTKLIIKKSGKSFLKKTSSASATVKKATIKYTVTYNLNGGKGKIKNQEKIKGKDLKLRTNKPKKDGYNFAGWSIKKNGAVTYKSGATYKKNSNVKLYAKWVPKSYKITYKNLKGANNKNKKTYTIETSSFRLKKISKKGYEFAGWYKDSKYKNKITNIKKGTYGNKTLYAKWRKVIVISSMHDVSKANCDRVFQALNAGTISAVKDSGDWYYKFVKGDTAVLVPTSYFETKKDEKVPYRVTNKLYDALNTGYATSDGKSGVNDTFLTSDYSLTGNIGLATTYFHNFYKMQVQLTKNKNTFDIKCKKLGQVSFEYYDMDPDTKKAPTTAKEYMKLLTRVKDGYNTKVTPIIKVTMKNPEQYSGELYFGAYSVSGVGKKGTQNIAELLELGISKFKAISKLPSISFLSYYDIYKDMVEFTKPSGSDMYKNSGEKIYLSDDTDNKYCYAYKLKSPLYLVNDNDWIQTSVDASIESVPVFKGFKGTQTEINIDLDYGNNYGK